MKKILLISTIAAVVSAMPTYVSANENMALRICEYVAANDKNRLRAYLKKSNLKVRKIFKDIGCNGENLLVFAARSKALDVGDFLIGKTSSKTVQANIDAIAAHSAHMAEQAKKRIK